MRNNIFINNGSCFFFSALALSAINLCKAHGWFIKCNLCRQRAEYAIYVSWAGIRDGNGSIYLSSDLEMPMENPYIPNVFNEKNGILQSYFIWSMIL